MIKNNQAPLMLVTILSCLGGAAKIFRHHDYLFDAEFSKSLYTSRTSGPLQKLFEHVRWKQLCRPRLSDNNTDRAVVTENMQQAKLFISLQDKSVI